MALELFMLGLTVRNMNAALAFYRQLGLAIPEVSEGQSHVEIKMGSGFTFFLDSNPERWDPEFARETAPGQQDSAAYYPSVLEFYLKSQTAVEAKYAELVALGYTGYRAPYATGFKMCFAMVKDPDGNTILLSGDQEQ